eukprot:243956-Alexandrium_andersonii.AAC.1
MSQARVRGMRQIVPPRIAAHCINNLQAVAYIVKALSGALSQWLHDHSFAFKSTHNTCKNTMVQFPPRIGV